VGEQRVGQKFALDAKLGDGAAEIDGVPEGDGGDREVETRGPVALIFQGAVADLAVTMEKGVLGTMERRVRLSHWFSRGSADSALGLVFRATKYT
jgi:hypothetical protein